MIFQQFTLAQVDRRAIHARLGRAVAGNMSGLTNKVYGDPTPPDLKHQAETYYNLVKTCRQSGNVSAFLTWGFTDKYSWIPWKYPGNGWALPLDKNYQPKPAAYAIEKALRGESFLGGINIPQP